MRKFFKKLFPCKFNNPLCKDSLFGCRCGVIGTTAALITAGALAVGGGVMAASAARESSQQAVQEAEIQRQWQAEQYAPTKALEALQLQQYKDITMPYQQSIYDLWKQYGQPQTAEQYKIFGEVGLPAERTLAEKLRAGLEQPLQLPQDIWDKIWQQAREKTYGEYAGVEQKTSQRLAATGGLGQGPAQSLFKDIELGKAKSIESLAINQAIAEWTEKKTAQQTAYENVFKLLGYTPGTTAPAVSTGAVGTVVPYTAIPATTSGIPEGISTGLRLADLFAGLKTTATPTTQITGGVGGQTMQTSQFGQVWSPYK